MLLKILYPSSEFLYFSVDKIYPSQGLNLTAQSVWTFQFIQKMGLCNILDIHQIPGLNHMIIEEDTVRPTIVMKIKSNISDINSMIKMIIHNRLDGSDARVLHNVNQIQTQGMSYIFRLSKKVTQSVSTDKRKCQNYSQTTCILRNMYQHFLDSYGCEIVMNRYGPHLEDLRETRLKLCDISTHTIFVEEFKNLSRKYESECPSRQPCQHVKYFITLFDKEIEDNSSSIIKIQLSDAIVEYGIEEISYDLQSLIGEVGGTLGLTIGLSFLAISDWFFKFIDR